MPPQPTDNAETGLGGLGNLDKLLEHRVRLGICILLARNQSLSFSRLKALLGETDGSLGAHLLKLEEGGFLTVRKEFQERKPVSWYALTVPGRAALDRHLKALEELIAAAANGN